MRKALSLFLSLLLTGAAGAQKSVPAGLMVEFIRDPAGVRIMDLNPEFSWLVPGNIARQSAYQIIVSAEETLNNRPGLKWDSNKISDPNSSSVEYAGPELSANSTYSWKVRIWDEKNRPGKFSEEQVFTTGNPPGYMTTKNRFVSTLIDPVRIINIKERHFFIDFGRDAFGTLVLKLRPSEKDTIIVHLGEKISSPNTIDRNPGGTIRYQKILLPIDPEIVEYSISLPSDPRNTGPAAIHLPDSFGVVMPFRYCELENCNFQLTGENIAQKAYFYYFDYSTSSFTSSDTILNQVWDLSKYSMKATSFAGIYIDGDRERIPYEADAYINQLGHYYTDREYSMARASNEYFMLRPTWPTEWILHTVLMFHNDFMFTGNDESLKFWYEKLKHKTLTSLAREDGLISSKAVTEEIMKNLGFTNSKERIRDIVDWPPAQKDTGWKLATPEGERDGYDMVEINTMVNAFYYRNLVLMSQIAGILGKTHDSEYYQTEAVKVRSSFNNKLFNRKKGIYTDGDGSDHSSLHANMMALAFDLVPVEYKRSVIEFIKSRGMACSVYGSQYLLEGLYRAGEADYALSLMTATHDRSWWNMIRTGSTIALEAWDMKYKPNSDWNHAWGAAPANIIPGFMWGISPAQPGFAKAVIKPQLSSLKFSKAEVPTIRGTIVAEYNDKGNSDEYLVEIPGNMECDFVIPLSEKAAVKINGKTVNTEIEIVKLKPGLNKILINKPTTK
jgi:hypothetical protein